MILLYRIIVHVLLPLLSINKIEIENFKNSPEEFVSLTSDICDKHV